MNPEVSYLTSSEDEYLSSDGEHLYMAPSPRSNSTTSPGGPRRLGAHRASTSSADACSCLQKPGAAADLAPWTAAIADELRRLYPTSPTSAFGVFVEEVVVAGQKGTEARALRDGKLIARGRACAGEGEALNCLKGLLVGTFGVLEGEVVVPRGARCEGCGSRR